MDRLKRFILNTPTDGDRDSGRPSRAGMKPGAQIGYRVTLAAESQVESGVESRGRGGSGGIGRRKPTGRSSNPIVRYIACFASVNAAAEAAGVSTAMLRRMRARGYVSTRDRALLMARACGFKLKPAELLALPPGGG